MAEEEEVSNIFQRFLAVSREGERQWNETEADTSAAEIGRQLMRIGDELEASDRHRLYALVDELVQAGNSTAVFISVLRQFVKILELSVGFPVSLINYGVAVLYMIWRNPSYAAAAKQGLSGTNVDQTAVVPKEIETIDVDAVQMYLNALKHGYEEVNHIRLMTIGQYSVGKTNLVYNLLGKDKSEIHSTDGIDVHITECKVSGGCDWTVDPLSCGETNFRKKLVSAMMRKGNDEFKSETDGGTYVIQNPEVETIYARCPAEPAEEHDAKKKELDNVKAVLDNFVEGGDPLLADYMKQAMEAIEIGQNVSDIGNATSLSLWDFAGQYIYYTTHHFFMNTRSIYLLVMDISQHLDKLVEDATYFIPAGSVQAGYTCLEAFKFWLNSIHTYSQNENDTKPTVILIGTHKDKVTGSTEEKKKYAESYFNEALEAFGNSPVLKHVHPVKFFIDNHSPEDDLEKLKLEIVKLAQCHSDWNERVPARWIQLERSIQMMKTEGKEIITLQELEEADSENEVPVNSQPELKLFLKFQHNLGNLLYFDKDSLENLIILSPQWIIDAFKCFVTQFPDKKPQDLHFWKDYEEKGILKQALIDAVLDGKECLVDYKKEIIKYMEQLDIMAKPSVFQLEEEECGRTTGEVAPDADQTRVKTFDDESVLKAVVGIETRTTGEVAKDADQTRVKTFDDETVLKAGVGTETRTTGEVAPDADQTTVNTFDDETVLKAGVGTETRTTGEVAPDADQTRVKTFDDETVLEARVGTETDVNVFDTDDTQIKFADLDINEDVNENSRMSDSLPGKSKVLDFYIVPCMLNNKPSPNIMQDLIKPQNSRTTPTLCFVFQGSFLPPAVFHRLLAVGINTWPISRRGKKFLLFNGLAVFDVTPTMTLTIWLQDHVIFANIAELSKKHKSIPQSTCKEVREALERALIRILCIYRKEKSLHDLPFEEYIHCGNNGDNMLGMVQIEQLREHGELKCSDHIPSHIVVAEKQLSLWFPEYFNDKYSSRMNDIPEEKELAQLSRCIGNEFWHVGLHLGLPQATLEQLQLQHRDIREHIYNILLEWKRVDGQDATLAVLRDALQTAGTAAECFDKVFL